MADDKSLDIQEVTVGSAANFRGTINSNFNEIKNKWTGIVRTNKLATANNALEVGGIWLETEQSNDPNITTGVSNIKLGSVVTIRGEIIKKSGEYSFEPVEEGEILYFIDNIETPDPESIVPSDIFMSIYHQGEESRTLAWYNLRTGERSWSIDFTIF